MKPNAKKLIVVAGFLFLLAISSMILISRRSRAQVQLVPEPHSSTNSLHLKFPIICKKIARGENVLCIDSDKPGKYFGLKIGDCKVSSAYSSIN